MGNPGSRILYLTANPNGEAETVTVSLSSGCRAHKKIFDFEYSELEIKGRGARGNTLTRYPVRKIHLKSSGVSTLGGLDVWYDGTIGRLSRDPRDKFLGNFKPDDSLLILQSEGTYEIMKFDINLRFDPEKTLLVEKFDPGKIVSCVYFDGENNSYYLKRFVIETSTQNKKFIFISESRGSKLHIATAGRGLKVLVEYEVKRKDARTSDIIDIDKWIEVKGWKAGGKKLAPQKIRTVKLLDEKPSPPRSDSRHEEKNNAESATALPKSGKKTEKLKISRNGKARKTAKPIKKTYAPGTTVNLKIKKKKGGKDQLKLFEN
jgi:topoisomerase-4 subunit A